MKISKKQLRKLILENVGHQYHPGRGKHVYVGDTYATFDDGSNVYEGPGNMRVEYTISGDTLQVSGLFINDEFQEPSAFGDIAITSGAFHSRRFKMALNTIKGQLNKGRSKKITKVDLVGKYQ
jgi:hypothetical protein